MPQLHDWTLQLKANDLLLAQGFNPTKIGQSRPALVKAAEWAIQNGLPLVDTTVFYAKHSRKSVSTLLSASPSIEQRLSRAEYILAVLCTIGRAVEDLTSSLYHSDPLRALAMDSFGSMATIALASLAHVHFASRAKAEMMKVSSPLSPGMEGWTVEQGQSQIFDLLNGEEIGVKLTSRGMMIPRKSLSFLLGIGRSDPSNPQSPIGQVCDLCDLSSTCKYQDRYDAT